MWRMKNHSFLPLLIGFACSSVILETVVSGIPTLESGAPWVADLDHLRSLINAKSYIDCFICDSIITTVRTLLKYGIKEDLIAKELILGCRLLHIEHAEVCIGAVDEFKAEAFAVLRDVTLSSSTVCSYVLSSPCSSQVYRTLEWNVTFPNVPKPPIAPYRPPKPTSPRLTVLHISDIHIDLKYKPGSNAECGEPVCCRDDNPKGHPAGKWGDYRNCDCPMILIDNLFQTLSTTKFDYILWTGDITSHRLWSSSKADLFQLFDYMTNAFIKYFPGTPVYPALGNHEGVPVNSFPPPSVGRNQSMSWLYERLIKDWKHWLPNSTSASIARGGFYTTLLHKGFRIVSLNTNYCLTGNWWLMLNSTDPVEELQWLIDVLQKAENSGEKVQIIGHVSPGISNCLKTWSWNYYKIVNRYESTIAGQFFGHTHTDSWEVFYDIDDGLKRPVSIAYIAPSVTPFAQLNPGYRVYHVDGFYNGSSLMVLDHDTFIMNLTDANTSDRPIWAKEYSAVSLYGLKSLTPIDWDLVNQRLLHDDQLFYSFHLYFYKSHLSGSACGPSCRAYLICNLRSARSYDPSLCTKELSTAVDNSGRYYVSLYKAYEEYLLWSRSHALC